ncbi:MAG: hypothetical protein K2O88_07910 [Paramuribaculum sp.]|nr:hypothetical protein [Paramuribaculum sp.]
MARKASNRKQVKRKISFWSKLFHGRLVSSDFFARNWLVIALLVIFLMAYISSNYTNKIKREQVARYKAQSEVMKTERNRARSKYMGKVRESAMQQLVDSLNLGLQVQDDPAFEVEGHTRKTKN